LKDQHLTSSQTKF